MQKLDKTKLSFYELQQLELMEYRLIKQLRQIGANKAMIEYVHKATGERYYHKVKVKI